MAEMCRGVRTSSVTCNRSRDLTAVERVEVGLARTKQGFVVRLVRVDKSSGYLEGNGR
jgi:hypothetical protein